MGLDIRLPIGLMFTVLGPVLIVTGFVDETPISVYTGLAMALFGGLMLAFGVRGQRRSSISGGEVEGSER